MQSVNASRVCRQRLPSHAQSGCVCCHLVRVRIAFQGWQNVNMAAPVLVSSHQIGWILGLPICYIHLCFRKSPVPDILWSQRHNTLDMKGSRVIICHCNGQRILDSSDHNMARHSGGSVRSVRACGPVLPANGNKNNGAPEKYIIA